MGFKKKLSKAFGDETLATTKEAVEEQPRPVKQQTKKAKPTKARKKTNRKESSTSNASDSKVLNLLGIDAETTIPDQVRARDVRLVEFTVTAPTGFDAEEVGEFLSVIERAFGDYEEAITKRDADVMKLVGEVELLEQKLINSQHAMSVMPTNELEDEVYELTLERDELKQQVNTLMIAQNNNDTTKLESEVKFLKARVSELRSQLKTYEGTDEQSSGLPNVSTKGLPDVNTGGLPDINGSALPDLGSPKVKAPVKSGLPDLDIDDNEAIDGFDKILDELNE